MTRIHTWTVLSLSLILICLAVCDAENATEVHEEPISTTNATNVEGKRTCACSNTESETLICASNGITYKSMCKFNCAKARVSRLRIIRQGQNCSQGGGSGNYWQKGVKG